MELINREVSEKRIVKVSFDVQGDLLITHPQSGREYLVKSIEFKYEVGGDHDTRDDTIRVVMGRRLKSGSSGMESTVWLSPLWDDNIPEPLWALMLRHAPYGWSLK